MHFSIRVKIIGVFVLFAMICGTVWALSYTNLFVMHRKLELIERESRLLETIFETRRYEKKFIRRHDIDDLKRAREYAVQAEQEMDRIATELGRFAAASDFGDQIQDLQGYVRYLDSYLEGEPPLPNLSTFEARLTDMGKEISGYIEGTVHREHRLMLELFTHLRLYLFLTLTGMLVMFAAIGLFLFRYVDRPLKAIERGIAKITSGDDALIPRLPRGGEFEGLIDNLNVMIRELKRRGEVLSQQEKMASLGTLTSGVAHELNNPLNNISTSLQILIEEDGEQDPMVRKACLSECEQEVDRARDIVRSLLTFSRKQAFGIRRVRFREVVDQALRLIRGEIPAGIQVVIDVPETLEADMDPARMEQVIMNLCVNGIHAMGDTGTLTVRAWADPARSSFLFSVADTGTGIAPEDLKRIIDPFFTTKEAGKGTGLGLSVSHGIIQQHGGQIRADSKPGAGSIFTVEIKLETR
ncbi:MAG: hypothetical protein CSA22_04450 [Deltaproteobacteria bacterium]|nr:MAG: hypothetical protein CSA22_04450 [Deltaproteobacteria bacterium]